MLKIYQYILSKAEPLLLKILDKRAEKGKEDKARIKERKGVAGLQKPDGPLIWLHAASVGEAQSALILINALLKTNDKLHILVTTGTVTSAKMMEKNLPERAFHQFYPLDHPDWVKSFIDHWSPDLVLWMESELWPNMLSAIKERRIPAALINARLSPRSFVIWKLFGGAAKELLGTFNICLAQTEKDAQNYKALGADTVQATGNLKYSAKPLPANETALTNLSAMTTRRPMWVYASTHEGEEALACRVHQVLKNSLPDLLTIIVPRHPDRGGAIADICQSFRLQTRLRGADHALPSQDDDIYIANTLGELGLFYRLTPVACIGRSFSDDGGGGHNPIEAMQLNCAVLFGPHVQNLQEIYNEINDAQVAIRVSDKVELTNQIRQLLSDEQALHALQKTALQFAQDKAGVLGRVLKSLDPHLEKSGILAQTHKE